MSKPDELTSDAREPSGERPHEAAPEPTPEFTPEPELQSEPEPAQRAADASAPPEAASALSGASLDDDALAFDDEVGFCSAHSLVARPADATPQDAGLAGHDASLFADEGEPQGDALAAVSGSGLEVRPEPLSEPVSFTAPEPVAPEPVAPEAPAPEPAAPETVNTPAAAAVVQRARAHVATARTETARSGKGHDLSEESRGETVPLFATYALTIGAIPTLGVGLVLGLIVAWLFRGSATPWLQTHYTYLIRTLIAAVIVGLVAVILLLVGIGIFIAFVLALWMLARGINGALRLSAGQPIRDPRSWLL